MLIKKYNSKKRKNKTAGESERSMRRFAISIILCMMLSVVYSQPLYAQEILSINKGLDVVFVMDSSGSMKSNDSNKMAMDMVKAFIDTVHIENIRIGFVSYNDKIVSSSAPISIVQEEERVKLKALIDSSEYSGNTDIGLGLSYAEGLMESQADRNRIMVLISDGETDLGTGTEGRTLEQSNQDMDQTVQTCQEQGVPIYTIAFGKYDGSKAVLEHIADTTGGEAYTAQNPESLIEVFYGIFGNNLSYKIQEVTNSIYAKGKQEIRYLLDEKYLDELDLLLISPQKIGETTIQYGDQKIASTSLSHYVVGKITEIDSEISELIVRTSTQEGQALKAYLVSYRNIVPVLEMESNTSRNESLPYQVYFKDKAGNQIQDQSFYKKFEWNMSGALEGSDQDLSSQEEFTLKEGVIQGKLKFETSGTYQINADLSDNLGSYHFTNKLEVTNIPPSGSLPEERYTILSKDKVIDLNEYFQDSNGDVLQFSLEQMGEEQAEAIVEGSQLTIKPQKVGIHAITLFVGDGEDTLAYPYQIRIIPLWQAYWWVIVLILLGAAALLWRIFHKPKPELVQIIEKKAQNKFSGKLDAYFTRQPEEAEEIPPLSFSMYKMRVHKVSLGELMKGYSGVNEALSLDNVYLIADEERRMILYHTSDALIMIGNSIVCRQIQYSVGFGDVIYISAPNTHYELEIHYIAMIQ